MRIQTTITDMSGDQWVVAQGILTAEYDIPADATRVCLTLDHEGEDRHVGIPLGAYIGLLGALGMDSLTRGLLTAMAVLTPDAFPGELSPDVFSEDVAGASTLDAM
jgi:hypothetical protein